MTSIKLVLEDGSEIKGKSFGFEKSAAGEVVFNTAMTGYPESLTDPSYEKQILVLTYPLVGNYGVPVLNVENNMLQFFESEKIHVAGLIIADYSVNASHWNSGMTLSDWLKENEIPGIYDVDTRALTKIIREKGSMKGKIIFDNVDVNFYDPNKNNIGVYIPRTYYNEGYEKEYVNFISKFSKFLTKILSNDPNAVIYLIPFCIKNSTT